MKTARASDWLSDPGEYQDTVAGLCNSDPRLRSRCNKTLRQRTPWPTPGAQLVVLEAGQNDGFGAPEAHSPLSLQAYLAKQASSSNAADLRRVIILQGLDPAFIAVLGDHFKMHPSFFASHQRTTVFSAGSWMEDDTPPLPSTSRTSQHLTLKYFELISLPESVQGTFYIHCAATGRHIGITRMGGKFSDVGIMRRKCSIWRQASKVGSGWDCIILTDPPLTTASVRRNHAHGAAWPKPPREMLSVFPGLYQNGYVDFMPHAIQLEKPSGPPRSSFRDDLCFYLQAHSTDLSLGLNMPDAAVFFAKKIVAAHYLQLSQFMRSLVSHVQFHMSRLDHIDPEHFHEDLVEAQWSDAQALERRLGEYCEDLESLMLQCGIPLTDPDPGSCAVAAVGTTGVSTPAWDADEGAADFQVLRQRLQNIRRRAEMVNSATTGLAALSGNRRAWKQQELALREARNTKALTFVGLAFIPLAYTASLFSMAEPYGPGQGQFWIYFAVSVPLIVVVVGVYVLVHETPGRRSCWPR